jgi:hypothetical protein
MPPPRERAAPGDPTPGEDVEALLHAGHDHHEHVHGNHDGDHEGHHGDGGHDHHDMMAIVGDPSDDGLIMERLDFALGPLFATLPGGLVVDLSLDGDVVARAHARATLRLPAGARGRDPLAPLAYEVAVARARRTPSDAIARRQIAALEVERATSHALSLYALGVALGWRELTDTALELSRSLLPARSAAQAALDEASDTLGVALGGADRLAAAADAMLRRRAARLRLRGRAVVDRDAAESHKVGGPTGRAAGIADDARAADPLYHALGFAPQGADAGDAEARAQLRAAEIVASLALVRAAASEAGGDAEAVREAPGEPVVVEGPRGPLHAIAGPNREVAIATPGADGALAIAGDSITGLELGAAIVGLVSFDLSPWRTEA